MRHLTVGVFHDDSLGRELGKKGTLSDIAMYNRKADEEILTFMSPVEDKLTAKSQIISTIDAAIVVFSQMTRELGETILMLDLIKVGQGIAVSTPYASRDKISAIIAQTSLKAYRLEDQDPIKLLADLKDINPKRDNASPVRIVIDHSFNVKGVGEVTLGFIQAGAVKKYEKLRLLPAGKEVIVRSIQVHDEDIEHAEAGTRVGLAIKGASIDELERGSILTTSTEVGTTSKAKLSFTKTAFYRDELKPGLFHLTVGMQTLPVTVSDPRPESIVIESSNPIVYSASDTALLLDLNGKKTRVIGKGVFGAKFSP